MENTAPITFLTAPNADRSVAMLLVTENVILAILFCVIICTAVIWFRRRRKGQISLAAKVLPFLKRQHCRWGKASQAAPMAGSTAWTCQTCKITAYSQDRQPPKECKSLLGPKPL